MSERSDYKICPLCGASLDIDEKCDCEKDKHSTTDAYILTLTDIREQIHTLKEKTAYKG